MPSDKTMKDKHSCRAIIVNAEQMMLFFFMWNILFSLLTNQSLTDCSFVTIFLMYYINFDNTQVTSWPQRLCLINNKNKLIKTK